MGPKGQNVILGDFGEVIVLDWGLAKVLDQPVGEVAGAAVVVDQDGAVEQTAPGALVLARLGDYRRAAEAAQVLTRAEAPPSRTLHALAQVYSLCLAAVLQDARLAAADRNARVEQLMAQALQVACLAHALGYLQEQVAFDHLKKDPDLAALWACADFQKFMSELESRVQRKAP